MFNLNKGEKNMNTKEKEILKRLEETNSPMEFKLFMEENNPENFSWSFLKKFDELNSQVFVNYELKNGRA
tara:strand:+ start:810 stop:1019 length:210 start_codon:yes stop_codon:yes gene_type:complete